MMSGLRLGWISRARIVAGVVFAATLVLSACGKSDGGGIDQSPTFHSIAIIGSPLPTDPVAVAITPTLQMIDCYPGATVRLYGIDTIFAQGTATPSATDATSRMQWSSSTPSVATVSAGTVTCISQGTTQISGNVPGAACDGQGTPCGPVQMPVTVGSAKHTLTLSPDSISLNSGQSQQLSVLLTTETAPGVSTTQDVTGAVFSSPGQPEFLIIGAANAPPIDFANTQNGNIVAQGSGSAILEVEYQSYISNMVLFTSK
jgi:hypothetical protein